MKYLYFILRLFFCPHRYVDKNIIEKQTEYINGRKRIWQEILQECKYCGKLTKFSVMDN